MWYLSYEVHTSDEPLVPWLSFRPFGEDNAEGMLALPYNCGLENSCGGRSLLHQGPQEQGRALASVWMSGLAGMISVREAFFWFGDPGKISPASDPL